MSKTNKLFLILATLCLMITSCQDADLTNEDLIESRGEIVEITKLKTYSPKEFVKEYEAKIFGAERKLPAELFAPLKTLCTPVVNMLMAKEKESLNSMFSKEQGNTKDPKWEFKVYSYNFRSLDFKGQPVVLSGIVAFPGSTDPKSTHTLNGITLLNHPICTESTTPSKYGDAFLLRAFYNQAVVIPDQLGFGASQPYFFAETENERNSQNTIDAIIAAIKLMEQVGVKLKKGYATENFGVSHGGGMTYAFHHYMENKATAYEKKMVNLKGTFGGIGIISPGEYFRGQDHMDTPTVSPFYALSITKGILELNKNKLGGFEGKDFFRDDLFDISITGSHGEIINMMETQRNIPDQSLEIELRFYEGMQDFHELFNSVMFNSETHKFDFSNERTQAFFNYLDSKDLGKGWNPEHNFVMAWCDNDLITFPEHQRRAYERLRLYPDGRVCKFVKQFPINMNDYIGDWAYEKHFMLPHSYACGIYAILSIAKEFPTEVYGK